MKPSSAYRGSYRKIVAIFSIIPFTLTLLLCISYFTNPNITTTHLSIFFIVIAFISLILLIAALLIANFRLEIYENHLTINRTFSKQTYLFYEINKIELGVKTNKLASTSAPCFVFFLKSGNLVNLPVRPFEKHREEILINIKNGVNNNRTKKYNS